MARPSQPRCSATTRRRPGTRSRRRDPSVNAIGTGRRIRHSGFAFGVNCNNCELKATERIQSSPKTKNSCRELPTSKQLHEALRPCSRSPYVVSSRTRPSEPRSLREHHNRLLRSLGIGHVVFHSLRHTFATRCVESQCDYKTISAILGHANVATTLNLYVHPDMGQKRLCVERMSRFVETPTQKITTFADGEQNRLPTP